MLRPLLAAASQTRRDALAPLMGEICGALCGARILGADPAAEEELWYACVEACRVVVCSELGDELRRPETRLNVSAISQPRGCESMCSDQASLCVYVGG